MKRKLLSLILALSIMLSLFTFTASASVRTQSEHGSAAANLENLSKSRTENKVDPALVSAMNRFALRTGAKLLAKKGGCCSPVSLYYALALAAEGAKGQTAKEFYSLLGKDDLFLGRECPILYRRLNQESGLSSLVMANSLWLDQEVGGLPVQYREDFLQRAAERYYAEAFTVDFSDSATGKKMGDWVSKKTKGKLSFALEPDDEQMLSILNTVYYKSAWAEPFDKAATKKCNFQRADGKKKKVSFMHRTEKGSYYKGKGYVAASRAMGSGTVTFYLPDKGVKVASLLKKKELLTTALSKQKSCMVQWSVPKFKTGSKWDVIPTLKALGVKSAFTDDADFSALTDTPALITSVDQGTCFELNEKGAEAAAYTHIGISKATAMLPRKQKTVKMNLNRPFLYTVTSAEGVVLFLGIYDGK